MIRQEKRQQNNGGFTLIEIIFAMFILAIVSIPILNAFVSSARTSNRAFTKMRATNMAESVFEDLKTLTTEKAVVKYAMVPAAGRVDPAGSTSAFHTRIDKSNVGQTLITNEEVLKAINSDYYLDITMDPTLYMNANSVNMATFNIMDDATTAIYSMDANLESNVCKEYVQRNERLLNRGDMLQDPRDEAYFEQMLKREIRVDIEKVGEEDVDGKTVELCTVHITVTYLLYGEMPDTVVPRNTEQYRVTSKTIFNNSSSKKPLSAIALFYYPRYKAAGSKGDVITVHNPDNVSTNLYVVAQEANTNKNKFDDYTSKNPRGGLLLHIYEDEIANPGDPTGNTKKQPITLFTNLHDGNVAVSKNDTTASADLLCYLRLDTNSNDPASLSGSELNEIIYGKIKMRSGDWGDTTAGRANARALDIRDIDGRSLYTDNIQNRIYDVTIEIERVINPTPGATPTPSWPNKVTLTGTKLEK